MFQKGDLLRCLDTLGGRCKTGDIVTVKSISNGYLYVEVPSGEVTGGWLESHFIRAHEDSPKATPTLFELGAAAAALGPRARRVLLEVARRLAKGATEHGDFDPAKRRSWAREAAEERLDAIVYDTIADLERAGEWK